MERYTIKASINITADTTEEAALLLDALEGYATIASAEIAYRFKREVKLTTEGELQQS
jgi:hypothetical protein